MKKIKIYIFDVDGTLVPYSRFFRFLEKIKFFVPLIYFANNCYERNNKLSCYFVDIANNIISFVASHLVEDRKNLHSYIKILERYIESEIENSSIFFIITASYTYKFLGLENLREKSRIEIFWIPKSKKIEFFKILEKILKKYGNRYSFEIYQFNDDSREIYNFSEFENKVFLANNWKKTYAVLNKLLYHVE